MAMERPRDQSSPAAPRVAVMEAGPLTTMAVEVVASLSTPSLYSVVSRSPSFPAFQASEVVVESPLIPLRCSTRSPVVAAGLPTMQDRAQDSDSQSHSFLLSLLSLTSVESRRELLMASVVSSMLKRQFSAVLPA